MPDHHPSLNIHYDSDSDMHVDDDPDSYNRGPDLDADGESVDDDATVSPANSSNVNTSTVARLSISHSRPASVRPSFSYLSLPSDPPLFIGCR